jgi:hypothetical protein
MAERYDHRVLVSVDILEGEAVQATMIDAIASLPVVILGSHEVPEQTASGQARVHYEKQVRGEYLESPTTDTEEAR